MQNSYAKAIFNYNKKINRNNQQIIIIYLTFIITNVFVIDIYFNRFF